MTKWKHQAVAKQFLRRFKTGLICWSNLIRQYWMQHAGFKLTFEHLVGPVGVSSNLHPTFLLHSVWRSGPCATSTPRFFLSFTFSFVTTLFYKS